MRQKEVYTEQKGIFNLSAIHKRDSHTKTQVRCTDVTNHEEIVYEGNVEGLCYFLNIERHNIYNYIKSQKLYRHRYKIQVVDKRLTKPVILSKREEKEICDHFAKIRNIQKTAERFSLSAHTVTAVLVRYGLKEPKYIWEDRPKEKIDYGKLRALYNANWSIPKIADEFNTSNKVVEEILQEISSKETGE